MITEPRVNVRARACVLQIKYIHRVSPEQAERACPRVSEDPCLMTNYRSDTIASNGSPF